MRIDKINPLTDKEICVPGDKSISHRAVMISSLTRGKTLITNFLDSEDTFTTLKALRMLGVNIRYFPKQAEVLVKARGKYLKPDSKIVVLYMKESGTTIRLISGILAAQRFKSRLLVAPSLRKRPMRRIIDPLRLMGADVRGKARDNNEYPPLNISPVKGIKPIEYKLPVASAQVKSCVLFAGLYAKGKTVVFETGKSRNHTELMLKAFGASIEVKRQKIFLNTSKLKTPGKIFVPSDFSSAAFFIVLGVLLKKSRIRIKNVSVNSTRTGLLTVLRKMGANIRLANINKSNAEPYADIIVKSSSLNSVTVREDQIPQMIDEIPLLFVAASFAKGKTTIYGLKELKVKETDRINSIKYNLKKMGVDFKVDTYKNKQGQKDYKVSITGCKKFKKAKIKSFSDHRTAMSMIIANLALERPANIDNIKCVSKSFPEFVNIIKDLQRGPDGC